MTTNPLSYSSLNDSHLENYFQNKNIRKHLRNIGLINRYGDIIPYKEFEAKLTDQSRQEHLRSLLSEGIVQRVIQLEKVRQANIRNELEVKAKRIIVENVQEARQRSRQGRSNHFILTNRPKTSVETEQVRLKSSAHPSNLVQNQRPQTPKVFYPLKEKGRKCVTKRKEFCQLIMVFLGSSISRQSNPSQIVIMQQHSGGENLILFHNDLRPNEQFTIESRRENGYPFALSFYIDGIIDSRISVCCEYKHRQGVPLCGKRSSFAILNVQGGQPCQTCRFNAYMTNSP